MKKNAECIPAEEITFSDAFYGTYKIDKADGKPHLKEGLFHPFKDIWRMIFVFSAVVGSIMLPLMLSVHFQYFINAKQHPKFYEQPTWQDYILVSSFGIAFAAAFLILVIPRVFFCKGAMWPCFISAVAILNIAQVFSHYAMDGGVFSFSLETLLTIFWLIFSGCVETYLYGCGICMYAVGLTALINYFVAKVRFRKIQSRLSVTE